MYINRLNISVTDVYGFSGLDHTDVSIVLNKLEEPESLFLIIQELLRFGLVSSTDYLVKRKVDFDNNSDIFYYDFSLRDVTDKDEIIKILIDSFEFILNHKITFPDRPNLESWYNEHLAKITDFFKEALIIMKENKYHYCFQGMDGWS